MKLLKLPLNKTWKDAHDARAKLHNNPAWYSESPDVFDRIHKAWESYTLIMRNEESKAGVNARKRYQLI